MPNDKSSDFPVSAAAAATSAGTPLVTGGEPGILWKDSWSGLPLFVRILLWSTRNNRASASPCGSPRQGAAPQEVTVRIWDRPVRIVHWAFALLIPLAWWAVETGHMAWHYRFGYALLGLLIFRLIWGFAGSSTARFGSFLRSPRRVIEYLRGGQGYIHGHNPLGALSIIALLAVLAIQIGLDLFAANGNGSKAGPYADLIAPSAAHAVGALHQANFYLLLALIGLHVAAVLFYLLVRRDDLITPMLTGRRRAPVGTQPVAGAPAPRLFIAVAIAAGVTAWLVATFWQ